MTTLMYEDDATAAATLMIMMTMFNSTGVGPVQGKSGCRRIIQQAS